MTSDDSRLGSGLARSNDRVDFEVFYQETAKQINARAYMLLRGDRDAAYDVVQEGYVAMWRRWQQRRSLPLDSNTKYLMKIIYNKAVDQYQRSQSVEVFDEAFHFGDQRSVEEIVLSGQLNDIVRQRLDQESMRRRAVAFMYFLDGCDTGEIADALGVSRSTVRTQIERTRKILRPYLRKLEILQGGDR